MRAVSIAMKRWWAALGACWVGAVGLLFAAAGQPGGGTADPGSAQAKQAEQWILELADEQYPTREAASRHLWELGKAALPWLDQAVESADPERAIRATEVRERILMGITPKTDPVIMTWIEQYANAPLQRKLALMAKLRGKQAWKPMLRLYAAETNPEALEKLLPAIQGVPLRAARESLLAGQPDEARALLELAPNRWENLLALAEFHRSHGSLAEQREAAKSLKGINPTQWRTALAVSADDLNAVRVEAEACGMSQLAALAPALQGNPLPWFRFARTEDDATAVSEAYHHAANSRWKSPAEPNADGLRTLRRMTERPGSNDPSEVACAAFLIGEHTAAERGLIRSSPLMGFKYLEMLERVPEAYQTLGLDPDAGISADWVAETIKEASNPDVEDQHEAQTNSLKFIVMAGFLERRGLQEQALQAFQKPLLDLAATKENVFIDLLDELFGGRTALDGAPHTALRIAAAWAGDNPKRWDEIAVAALGDDDRSRDWWRLFGKIAPAEPAAARLEGLLALHQFGADPNRLREKWIKRVLAHLVQAEPKQRVDGLLRLRDLLVASGDLPTLREVDRLTMQFCRIELAWGVRMMMCTADGRWQQLAELLQQVMDSGPSQGMFSRPDLHAYAAAAWRRAGREAEARKHDVWADKLCLGDASTAQRIGYAYALAHDDQRAAVWWRRALLFANQQLNDIVTPAEQNPLRSYCDVLLEQRRWLELAALQEVQASCLLRGNASDNPLEFTRIRLIADLARALSLPANQRTAAVALLSRCHRDHLMDGTLADVFFPAIRDTFAAEHDQWFEETWQAIQTVIRRYPESDNTLNTAAWLAARACRRLPEARGLLDRALALRPRQAAYLDTYAEVEFAAGNRAKAVAWSVEAVNQRPNDAQLRRQKFRFETQPFPR